MRTCMRGVCVVRAWCVQSGLTLLLPVFSVTRGAEGGLEVPFLVGLSWGGDGGYLEGEN